MQHSVARTALFALAAGAGLEVAPIHAGQISRIVLRAGAMTITLDKTYEMFKTNSHYTMDHEGHLQTTLRDIEPEDIKREIKSEEIKVENIKQEIHPINDPLDSDEIKTEMEQSQECLEEKLGDGDKNITGKGPNALHMEENKYSKNASNEKNFKCLICNKSFTCKNYLTKHSYIHNNKSAFNCSICNKSFTRKYRFNEHSYTHTNELPFRCLVCNKSFTHKDGLTEHAHIHNNDSCFKCPICNKSFVRKYLIKHSYVHRNESPFKCSVCNKSFIRRDCLIKHSYIHSNIPCFEYVICKK
ncbi:hypothetical protein L9F63_011482 [Diploptera punctata]|uniref:C2H2-type domain-containing protein n=1 Tax=Diploptera punctata TaxID=6984 RepID=A0AAD8AEI2_DIPPU|nr:hypothetical protein L9F63_011482 [Diploptera punctata]